MSEQWIVAKPGGPAGPFWSIVSSSGRVIAMQIPHEATAKHIVQMRKDRVASQYAIIECSAECDDLRSQLAAAQSELHDLRIRAGMVQP